MLIATAGHVDHGKSALVRALTGVDTDRLPEERERGLSIELGFAYRDFDGARVGFVDVPGHERFVRTMVAGIMATDAVLLVVAADDGVMPQTREHVAILDLLDLHRGLVVVSKTDAVSAERIAEVREQIAALLAPTGLSGLPVFEASAVRGDGIEALRRSIGDLASASGRPSPSGGFRLAVDRSFSLTGAGTVVTGAVYSGRIATGADVHLLPAGKRLRLRGLRVQDRDAESAAAGDRAALNIAGVESGSIGRGDWIVGEQDVAISERIDVRLRSLPDLPEALGHWLPVHVHLGAADITGRLSVTSERTVDPGSTVHVQLVLDEAMPCAWGDPFILRDQSARRTLAGGHVVEPFGQRRGRNRPERIAAIEAFDTPDHAAALVGLATHTPEGVPLSRFAASRNLTDAELADLAETTRGIVIVGGIGGAAYAPKHLDDLSAGVVEALNTWHANHPDLLGATAEQLAGRLRPRLPAARIGDLLAEMAGRGTVSRRGGAWHMPDHEARPTPADAELWQRLLPAYEAAGRRPPRLHELADEFGIRVGEIEDFLTRMAGFGLVVRVSRNRFFRPETLRELGEIAQRLAVDGERRFDAADFRDASGIGRNLTIELLEFFDRTGLTRRTGDRRELRREPAELFGSG
jgi:selenocysteine-specific elongation factor